jgi:hypothetical protein
MSQRAGHGKVDALGGLRAIFPVIELQHVIYVLNYEKARAIAYAHLKDPSFHGLSLLFDVTAN